VQELGGSTARQPARLASGDIPYCGHHAQFRNGLAGGQDFLFHISVSSIYFLSRSSNFSGGFAKFINPQFPGSAIAAQGLAMNRSLGGEKYYIVCSSFCIFIITIITIISSSISFVVLLNCLYLNPGVLPFVYSPLHPAWGEEEG